MSRWDWTGLSDQMTAGELIRTLNVRMPRLGRVIELPSTLVFRVYEGYSPSEVQGALTAAFNAPGGTLEVYGQVTVNNLTLPDLAGAVRIVGMGRPRSFMGGVNGDPTAIQGSALIQSATATGDLFLSELTSGNKRQYITIENLYVQGNAAAATGHGLHFKAAGLIFAQLVCLRDVTVAGCKQHGVFFDGNVFESQFYNVRFVQNGDRGFMAVANVGAPGETRIYGATVNGNGVGVDISGGGHFSFHGLTASNNTNEGLLVGNVDLEIVDLQLEKNGTAAGNQATITGTFGAQLLGVEINAVMGGTGNGLSFVNSLWCHVQKSQSNSSITGGGYNDIKFDNGSSRCTVEDYNSDDFVERISYGTGGGHAVSRGRHWQSGQSRGQATFSVAGGGSSTPNLNTADDIVVTATSVGTVTVNNPTASVSYHHGQLVTITLYNNSGGVVTFAFGAAFHLAGAIASPANGTRRVYTFVSNADGSYLTELSRSAADIT